MLEIDVKEMSAVPVCSWIVHIFFTKYTYIKYKNLVKL